MQKHLRCESVDKDGHRCNKKVGHDKLDRRKNSKNDQDPEVRRHSAFGKSW